MTESTAAERTKVTAPLVRTIHAGGGKSVLQKQVLSTLELRAMAQQFCPNGVDSKTLLSYNRNLGQFIVLCSWVRPAVQRISRVTDPKEVSLRNSASNGSCKQACSLG